MRTEIKHKEYRIKNRYTNSLTTIESRTGEIADNLTNNNALLYMLKKKGKIKTFSGGDCIFQELKYADATNSTANSYSGYETVAVNQFSPISAARFDINASI